MTRPPCPTPIVAAGVLLIVVGVELVLVSLVFFRVLLFAPCGCAFAWTSAIGLVLANYFVLIGIATLSGTVAEPARTGGLVIRFGCFASVLSVFAVVYLGWEVPPPRAFAMRTLQRVAGLTGCGVTTAMTLTAGWLLRRNAGRYLDWQKRLQPPPENDGYEPEELA